MSINTQPKETGLRVYGGCLDGRTRLIVAARTRSSAKRAIGCTRREFERDFCETRAPFEAEIATADPGIVFGRQVNAFGAERPWSRMSVKVRGGVESS